MTQLLLPLLFSILEWFQFEFKTFYLSFELFALISKGFDLGQKMFCFSIVFGQVLGILKSPFNSLFQSLNDSLCSLFYIGLLIYSHQHGSFLLSLIKPLQ